VAPVSATLRIVGDPDLVAESAVIEIVRRCAPWLRLRVGDRLSDGACGAWEPEADSDTGTGDVLVSTARGFCDALDTAHHEVWHAVEGWLTPDALGSIEAMAAGGRAMPTAYLDDPAERRARLYASLARAWDEGLRVPIGLEDRALAVIWHVYSGAGARDIAARRERASRPPRSRLRRAWDAVFG